MTPIVGNALVGPASHVQNNSPDHGRVKVCHLSQNFCTQISDLKSQVESIFQCFGLILMDPLGALLNTLGANLLKSVFLETPCTWMRHTDDT